VVVSLHEGEAVFRQGEAGGAMYLVITGRVGLRLVDAGNIIHASDAAGLVVITQLQPIAVLFTIPSDQLSRVSTKVTGGTKLAVEAWDRELKNRLAVGTLIAIDNQIDPTTGTVRLKALFPNESSALYSNQFVNARLLVDTLHGVVLVPTDAIQRSPQSTFAWVVGADDKVLMKNVVVQLTEGDQAAIQSGLAEGDRVVIDGVDKLQPGTKVALAAPGAGGAAGGGGAANAPGGSAGGSGRKGKGKAAK
jgi:multidrug efflux system membrane fusion protein